MTYEEIEAIFSTMLTKLLLDAPASTMTTYEASRLRTYLAKMLAEEFSPPDAHYAISARLFDHA